MGVKKKKKKKKKKKGGRRTRNTSWRLPWRAGWWSPPLLFMLAALSRSRPWDMGARQKQGNKQKKRRKKNPPKTAIHHPSSSLGMPG
jgi:hypothetical protein